ncbi:MAG TPA: hypothetical protein C5S50_01580 [Methanosarcinaceae archaeon]|nr:hypothetical protein [Methanosarcinaceae archaeon]HJH30896.1 hypothetical protein [Methanosarcinaceae archaeon]
MVIDSAVLFAIQDRDNGMIQEYVLTIIFELLNRIILAICIYHYILVAQFQNPVISTIILDAYLQLINADATLNQRKSA